MVQLDSGYTGFQTDIAATTLVRRAQDLGSSAAVDWLEKIFGIDEASGFCILAIRV